MKRMCAKQTCPVYPRTCALRTVKAPELNGGRVQGRSSLSETQAVKVGCGAIRPYAT